jgi:hypothetical protein
VPDFGPKGTGAVALDLARHYHGRQIRAAAPVAARPGRAEPEPPRPVALGPLCVIWRCPRPRQVGNYCRACWAELRAAEDPVCADCGGGPLLALGRCRSCYDARRAPAANAAYYAAHRAEVAARSAAWDAANADRRRARQAAWKRSNRAKINAAQRRRRAARRAEAASGVAS